MGANKHQRGREQRNEKMPKVPAMDTKDMEKVEEILEYHFKNHCLIEEALTHPSFYIPYKPEVSYERLEFIGDAVLNCLVADWVFSMYPDLAPGLLTRLRAANVDTEKLARVAVCSDLYLYLRHRTSVLNEQIQEFMEGMKEHPNHSNGLLDPPKVLADIVESVLGAIFIDSGRSLETVWKAFKSLAEPLIDLEKLGRHPVAELQEFCQKRKLDLKFKKESWTRNMNVEVLINGTMVGSATYGNKKEIAMNRAAKRALDRIKEEIMNPPEPASPAYQPKGWNRLSKLWSYWNQRVSPTILLVPLLTAVAFKLLILRNRRTS